jgi:hypothetical protein
MTDEEKGRAMYEKEARNWPNPLEWDKLPKGLKFIWAQRCKEKHHDDED